MRSIPWRPVRWIARVGAGSLRLAVRRGRTTLWEAAWDGDPASEVPNELARLLSEAPAHHPDRQLHLELDPPISQVRHLANLPPVGRGALQHLVAQQAGRFFRHGGADLVTDARWLGQRRRGLERPALVVAAEARILFSVIEAAQTAGFTVATVRPTGLLGFDLRPAALRAVHNGRRQRGTRRLAAAVLVLWFVVFVAAVGRLLTERRGVVRELTSLSAPLEAIRQARISMDRASIEVEAVAQAERERGQLARAVLKLADALPDSAIITSASVNAEGRGTVSGLAARPLEVVVRLEESGALFRPRLNGSPGAEAVEGTRWERFTIASDSTESR